MARMGIKGYDGEGGFSGVEGKFGRDPLLYQGNITGRGFNGETMRGARPRDWQTDPSDMDWNAFGNPMQDRMAPDLSGENPNYMQDSLKYIGDERYDEEDPAQLAAFYRGMADKGIGMPENRELEEEEEEEVPMAFNRERFPREDARRFERMARMREE